MRISDWSSDVCSSDLLYVTGTIGEAHLGLLVLRGELGGLPEETLQALIARYRLPEPRLAAGQALLAEGLARSALDVSGGLAADLGHLLEADRKSTRELQSLMRISYAVFCLKKKNNIE